jgi:L-asparaginase II
MEYTNYVDYDHPYQKLIRNSLEYFTESSIKQKCIGVDGCNAPQYAFSIDSLTNAIINLINKKNDYSKAIGLLLNAIAKYPFLIGGKNRFDSEVIKHTEGRIFCKGGAEGVLLFVDISKKIGGVLKIEDGNERAIPPLAMKIFYKLKLLSINEKRNLIKWTEQILYNHTKKVIGKISAKIML